MAEVSDAYGELLTVAKRAMALDGVPAFEPIAEPLKVAEGSWLERQILQATEEVAALGVCDRFQPSNSRLSECRCGRLLGAHSDAAVRSYMFLLTQQLGRIP